LDKVTLTEALSTKIEGNFHVDEDLISEKPKDGNKSDPDNKQEPIEEE
jgi:hypothetical protein